MQIVPVLKKVAVLTLGALLLSGSASIYGAQQEKLETKRILVLYSFPKGLPWEKLIDENLRATLASQSTFLIELNTEHTDWKNNHFHKSSLGLEDSIQYQPMKNSTCI